MWTSLSSRTIVMIATFLVALICSALDALRDAWVNRKEEVTYISWHIVKLIAFFLPFVFIYCVLIVTYFDFYTFIYIGISAIVCRMAWKFTYKRELTVMVIVFKLAGKVVKAIFPWETILSFLLEVGANVLRDYLKGKEFTLKSKYFVIGMYALNTGYGRQLAIDTKTTVDDKLVDEIDKTCFDIAARYNFQLPIIDKP